MRSLDILGIIVLYSVPLDSFAENPPKTPHNTDSQARPRYASACSSFPSAASLTWNPFLFRYKSCFEVASNTNLGCLEDGLLQPWRMRVKSGERRLENGGIFMHRAVSLGVLLG